MDFGELDFSIEDEKRTPELIAWRSKVRQFVEAEIQPHLKEWESGSVLAIDCIKKLGRFGFFRFHYPKRLGGLELPPIYEEIALEELGRVSRGARTYMVRIQRNYSHLLDDGVAEHLELLERVLEGEFLLAFLDTEAKGGSDGANIQTTAVPDGDDYIISGQKAYISFVPGVDLWIVTALTAPELSGKRGMSLFLVPHDAPGISVFPVETPEKPAWHTLSHVRFADVRVPSSAMLGEKNRGFYLIKEKVWARRGLDHRLTPAEAKTYYFDEPLALASQRYGGTSPIHQNPTLRDPLIEAFGLCEMFRISRLRTYPLFAKVDRGERTTGYSAVMQLFLKVIERRLMLNRLYMEGETAIDGRNPTMEGMIFHAGSRAAGGGVDVHRIMLGVELYGPEWNVARE